MTPPTVMGPLAPIPAALTPCPRAMSVKVASSSSTARPGSPTAVGTLAWRTTWPLASRTTTRVPVPPRSTPRVAVTTRS
ncbi:MAG TPA: hypothetical protein VGI21_18995 [Streptosporangiaceae bacterium]